MSILAYYFRNYGLRKRWLLKRLKGRASEDHAVINVLTIILFFHAFGSSKHCKFKNHFEKKDEYPS